MAIHDYVIANQNGANTRSDLNNAFSAIVSNNSSATEPTTTYAYQWWADTGNDILKQRNAADSAWISILTLSTGVPLAGMSDIVDDTTPQLGGDLDLNGNDITGTGAIPSANLSGALPAIDGSALTGISADDNTPSFSVRLASNQSISNSTWTKLLLSVEDWDTDAAFASNKFTVPSGEAGKYQFTCVSMLGNVDDTEHYDISIYVNGALSNLHTQRNYSSVADVNQTRIVTTLSLAVADYVEVYVWHNQGSSQNALSTYTSFTGFKLAGV